MGTKYGTRGTKWRSGLLRKACSAAALMVSPSFPSANDDELFRQITEHVCGSLDLSDGLTKALPLLGQRMPVDALHLTVIDTERCCLRSVAWATRPHALSSLASKLMVTLRSEDADPSRWPAQWLDPDVPKILNRPGNDPVLFSKFKEFGLPTDISVLSILLDPVDEFAGRLGVFAEGNDRYTEAHARLLKLLRVPFNIALANAMRYEQAIELRDRLQEDNLALRRSLQKTRGLVIGAQHGLRHVMDLAERVAPTLSPVLLEGETGAGKEVVAAAVHDMSPRRGRPMVSINCGAIPEALVNSELFGHERGAFTDASSARVGLFERADGSTIFLDEIGELPVAAQVKLLRVLQTKEFERVGGTSTHKADVRVIAATHRNLDEMVSAGTFREDLLYRLNVFPIYVPPLRQRLDDIPLLVAYFMESRATEMNLSKHPRLAEGAMEQLLGYSWPGNVRELRNVIERALILYQDEPLQFPDLAVLPPEERGTTGEGAGALSTLADAERTAILRALDASGGKLKGTGGAAELLDLHPSTLRNKILRLGIEIP